VSVAACVAVHVVICDEIFFDREISTKDLQRVLQCVLLRVLQCALQCVLQRVMQ